MWETWETIVTIVVVVGGIAGGVGAIAKVIGAIPKVLHLLKGTTKPKRVTKFWVFKTTETYTRIADKATIIRKRTGNRLTHAKQRLALHWAIRRKKVRVNIQAVMAQDKDLKEISATKNERMGMAAITLSIELAKDHLIQNATCQKVFALIRQDDDKLFRLLCARIADDIVTNPDAQFDETGANYILPWDSVLEEFLKVALDELQTGTPQSE